MLLDAGKTRSEPLAVRPAGHPAGVNPGWYPSGVILAYWLIGGAAFGLPCGLIAIRRNRSATLWWIYGLVTGPIALVVLLTRERREEPAFL